MRSGSRSWWWVLPVSLSLVGCRSPIERDIDNGNEAKLVQTLASPDGQAKLAARGDRWLQRAVQAGQAESVEALLKAGALRDAAGPEGRLLLSQAMTVEDGRAAAQVLRVLVRHGVSPWAPDAQGRTALHEALETGRPGVVKELLALFPDLEGFDARPTRLLARAAQLGDLESVQLLVRAGVPLEEGALLSASLPPDILRPLRGAHLHFLLERASERGDAAELRSLVSGTVPEVWNAMHVGPAHLAVLGNDRRRLATLLKEPESREAVDDRGLGLLHQAALSAEPRTAHALAKAEVDLEARTPSGRTPLMLAAQRGRVDMVRELMGLGAEVNAEDAAGQSALSLAARGGHASTVDALVSGGAFLVRARALEGVAEGPLKQSLEAAHARFLLRWATETGQHAEEVRLRRAGASVAPWMGALDITPYVRALLEEDLPRLQELASAHPEDFARLIHQREGRTLLHWAALGGAEKSAAWLLEKGAWLEAEEPSRGLSQGGTPLGAAVAEGKWGVAALWVARGAVWTQEPVPGTPAERERVLELGRKNAALKEALRDGRLEALPELLQAGARMAAAGEGLVPSALAGRVLEGDALSELTRRELGARGAEAGGRTPLHYAAAAGNVAAVEKLLALGAAVSPRDRTGVTPLGYAARSGHVPTVNRLLAARASPLEPARPGTSALEAALCAPHPEAALLLLSRAGSATVSADCWPRALSQVLARGEERDALALLERWEPAEKDFPLELALEAAGRDRAEVVRWLLDYQGPLMRAHHRALLVRAAEAGARGTVALLLDRAPAGDEQRRLQETARLALVAGRSEVAMLALDRGAEALKRWKESDPRWLVGATPAAPEEVSLAGLALALGDKTFLEHLRQRQPETWKRLQGDLDAFALAVRGGQLELVRRYVVSGANLLGEDATGAALLGTAGTVEVASWLFEQGAILEPPPPLSESTVPSVESETPFSIAVHRGHFDVARFFLSRGATARVAPLFAYLDARLKQGEGLEMLGAGTLQALAGLFQESSWTAAQRAEVVAGLSQRFCDASVLFEPVLSRMSAADVAQRTGPVLARLMRCEDPRALEVLVRRGANPHAVDGEGLDVLARAIRARNLPAVRTLLALGVQPLAAGGEPFARVRLALEQEQEALARELLESGLKDRVLEPAWRDEGLVLALRARAWTLAARLLSEGARVRAPVAAGPTALSLAASDGGPWMQELFLSMGATDSTGAALEVLLGRGEGEAVRRLLREGRVPPDIAFARLSASPASHALLREWSLRSWKALSRENQEALLRLAVGRDDDALAIFLMEQAGLDARLQDEAGRTLLHLAAGQAGPKLVEYLVSRGVPLDAEAPRCVRALDLARERGDREGSRVARLLEEQGATAGGCAGPATGE